MDESKHLEVLAALVPGNAISVYFSDPEGKGIEVFCDTPWHVQQPKLTPWDPNLSDDEILSAIEANFKGTPEFKPMEHYREQQAKTFGET